MNSGGGRSASKSNDNDDQISPLNTCHHPDHRPLEKNGKSTNNHRDYHLLMPCKSIIRISLMHIAAAVACFVLYSSAHSNQCFSITWPNPLSSLSQGSEKTNQPSLDLELGNSSDSPDEFLQQNGSEIANKTSSMSDLSSPRNITQETLPSLVNQENEESQLDKVLDKAAMANKTVIIATLNAAWIASNSVFDLFLESFKIGNGTQRLLCHVVVVALDQNAYSRCLELHPDCYTLGTKGVDFSGEANFMTPDYLKMMWRRMEFLQIVLQMGYSFIVTDVNILWLRDPFPPFYGDADIQVSSDHYGDNSTDSNNIANTGFYYVKSNEKTIKFYKFWYKSKDRIPGRNDQDAFNGIRRDPLINKIGLEIEFLDTAFFGGFCKPSKDLNLVCTMHANCCVGSDKIHDLRMSIEDWKKYMALPIEERTAKPQSWTVRRICGFLLGLQ